MNKKQGKKTIIKTDLRQGKGITLIALVITIIILLILATVTLNVVLGEGGLIERAQFAKDMTEEAAREEQEALNTLMDEYANIMAEDGNIEVDERSEIEKARDEGTVFDTKTELSDINGNKVKVPEGFKIAEDSGLTVQEGVVIEDVSASTDENVQGSQFVWIPVGKFIKDDGSESSEIILGRYSFDNNGTPTLEQNIVDYASSVGINIPDSLKTVVETHEYREGTIQGDTSLTATAKNLKGFYESAMNNGGYYFGRYEASYASGEVSDYSTCKASTIISKNCSETMNYVPGTLWNNIIQQYASKVAINTYSESDNIESDLISSYAWDTAIVYIQEATGNKYSLSVSVNSTLGNTGNNNDEQCNINDMASNLFEYTTEYCTYSFDDMNYPLIYRGGSFGIERNTAYRPAITGVANQSNYSNNRGFRLCIYWK